MVLGVGMRDICGAALVICSRTWPMEGSDTNAIVGFCCRLQWVIGYLAECDLESVRFCFMVNLCLGREGI